MYRLASSSIRPHSLAVLLAVGLAACSAPKPIASLSPEVGSPGARIPGAALGLAWTAVDSLQRPGLEVWAGRSDAFPLRAWAVRLDAPGEGGPALRVLAAADPSDGREAPTEFADRTGACVVLNGGYFHADGAPAGLAAVDGRVMEPATDAVTRGDVRYPVARGALGITERGVELAWAGAPEAGSPASRCEASPGNRPGRPAPEAACPAWDARDALGAGPMLLKNGVPTRSADAEGFFGTSIPRRHPRSAIGVEADGAVWLVVVDGRQPLSRGVRLGELAELMAALGARDALNLDGGGSSALVVASPTGPVRLNLPTGYDVQREVGTALGAFCE